jgi:hydroxymethylbilane synthase
MSDSSEIILGTRGSDLALWQARFIKGFLQSEFGLKATIKEIVTVGDADHQSTFQQLDGIGFFTKEIEDALLKKDIDIAVHSLKDLTTTLPEGLTLAALGFREDRRELLLVREEFYAEGAALPVKDGSVIGTASARRKAQVRHFNSTLQIKDIRGNVPTRIQKLRDGEYDAILLAAAGVKRLNSDLSGLRAVTLDSEVFLPAPAQGVLGIEARADDHELLTTLAQIGDKATTIEVALERGLLKKFDQGCSLPLGVFTEAHPGAEHRLFARLEVTDDSGALSLREIDIRGTDPEEMVERAYAELTAVKVG